MKRLFAFLFACTLIISLFTACSHPVPGGRPAEPGKETRETEPPKTTDPPETTEPRDEEKEQRQLFYDFLKNTHIPEVSLADLSTISWTPDSSQGGSPQHLLDCGRGGLLSAVVRDFDLDGNQDMVTFYMEAVPYSETWPAIYSGDRPVYNISMSLYMLDGEQIVLSDSYPCLNHMDGSSWGYISVRMELMEEGIYLSSHSYAEDYSTYGASPTTIFHVADGKFVFDYIGGIHYGQSSIAENPNLLMGTTNINPSDYTISTISKTAGETDPNGDAEENRWIYYGKFENTDWSSGTMEYTGTDYTGLRIILEQGIDAFPHEPLPQGGKKPEDPAIQMAKDAAQPIADHVSQQTGCQFIGINTYFSESTAIATVRFETEDYTMLSVSFDANTGRITSVGLSTNDYPVPQEWFNMKDALLKSPHFGLIADEISQFLGKSISYTKHMDGTPITGAKITIMQITDTYFAIRLN